MNPVVAALRKRRFLHQNEAELQEAIAMVLAQDGIPFEREVVLGPRDRIDFLCGTTGIEVKVDSSSQSIAKQLLRYAQSPRISELVLVTARIQSGRQPERLNAKVVHVVFAVRGFA